MKQSPSRSRPTDAKRVLAILCTSLLLAVAVNSIHPRRIPWVQDWNGYAESKAIAAGIRVVPLSRAYALHQAGGHLFVDARPADEYAAAHIPGAVSLPFQSLDGHVDALAALLESDRPLVVYCSNRKCDDALLLALQLQEMGQTNLLYYADGFERWRKVQ